MHPFRSAVLFSALAALACAASAATVTAALTDRGGRPLRGAVAMLEPTGAKLAVKPMQGVEVSQARRKFNPDVTVVTVGTPVTFPNLDSVRHHVYSFSTTKAFELKLYAGTPSVPVLFDKAGVVVIGCNIHDQMAAWVVVTDTPFHGRSADAGTVRFEGVPAGTYRLRVWHAALPADAALPFAAVAVTGADVAAAVRVDIDGAAP